jgi:tetratricopeptide (TPR) repeat protein
MDTQLIDRLIEKTSDQRTSVQEVLALWRAILAARNERDIVRALDFVLEFLIARKEHSLALGVLNEFETALAEVRKLQEGQFKRRMLQKRVELLRRLGEKEAFWQAIREVIALAGYEADLLLEIEQELVAEGRLEEAWSLYRVYLACVETELILEQLGVMRLSFPHTLHIPEFVRERFYTGSEEVQAEVAEAMLGWVRLMLRTQRIRVFPPPPHHEEFLEEVAIWLEKHGQQVEAARMREVAQGLYTQYGLRRST